MSGTSLTDLFSTLEIMYSNNKNKSYGGINSEKMEISPFELRKKKLRKRHEGEC